MNYGLPKHSVGLKMGKLSAAVAGRNVVVVFLTANRSRPTQSGQRLYETSSGETSV